MTPDNKAATEPHELELYNAINLVRDGFVLRDRISDDEAQPYFSAIEYVIRTALTTPAANTGDIVKPLDWQERNNGNRYCVTAVGAYEIGKDGFVYSPYICKYPSYEEGMAALLKDYTTKVSSLLAEPALAPRQVDVMADMEAKYGKCCQGTAPYCAAECQVERCIKHDAQRGLIGNAKAELKTTSNFSSHCQVDVEGLDEAIERYARGYGHIDEFKPLFEAARLYRRGLIGNAPNVPAMSRAYEEERAKYVGGTVYYPDNSAAFVGAMQKALGTAQAEPALWVRDVDGTGSLHPCLKGDPGAIPLYR